MTDVSVKPAQMGGILAGALLLGSGLAVLGYCPGTSVAAVGEGRRDALAGVLGMVGGALTFVVGFASFARLQRTLVDWGQITLPDATNMAPAIHLTIHAILAVGLYALARHVNRRKGHAS